MRLIINFISLFIIPGVILIVFPILIVFLYFPFFLYRKFIDVLAHYLYKSDGLGKMVSIRGSLLTADKMYTNPQCTLMLCLTVKGLMDISRIREHFKFIITETNYPSKKNTPWYPELQQYLFKFGGYSFWKNDKNFNLDDHVYYLNDAESDERLNDNDIHRIRGDLLNKKWRKDKPLWELVIVNNFYSTDESPPQGPLTIWFFRIHHSLADGKSLFTLFTKHVFQCEKIEFTKAKIPAMNIFSRLLYAFTFPLKAPWALAKIVTDNEKSPWSVPEAKKTVALYHLSPLISVQSVKAIKDYFNVSFTSVILAAVTGAHRETFLRKNIPIPHHLKCLCPFPLPNHSGKLRNYTTVVFPSLPVNTATPTKRLLKCHEIYEGFRTSPDPLVFSILSVLNGVLPDKLSKQLVRNSAFTTGMTCFPAGENRFSFRKGDQSISVEDVYFNSGLLVGNGGSGFTILSYNGNIRVCGGVSDVLMNQSEVYEFTLEVARQIEILHKQTIEKT